MAVDPKYLKAVADASKKYGVPADLLGAQIGQESGWNPKAKNPSGATGISQFMPATAKGFGINPNDPMQSIDAQAKMMSRLIKQYKGDENLALAAYNAGSGNVAKYKGIPPFKETQNYIKVIQANRKRYPGLAAGNLPLPSGAESTVPSVPAKAPQTAPPGVEGQAQGQSLSPFGLTPGGLLQAAKAHLGETQKQSGISFIEQALGQSKNPSEAQVGALKLPSGGFAQTQVNKLEMSPDVADPKLSPSGQGIVQAALKFKGTPYSWGGGNTTGPTKGTEQGANTKGFDCSGLVQYSVFQATGQKIPRVASAQYAASTKVPLKNAKPGDIVAFGSPKNIHHIGIYVGDGKFIEAPHTGDVVKVSSLAGRSDLIGVGRY